MPAVELLGASVATEFDQINMTLTIPVPPGAVVGSRLFVILTAQSRWSGPDTDGFTTPLAINNTESCPLFYVPGDFDQAPYLTSHWWADELGNANFPGWDLGDRHRAYQYATILESQGFNGRPIASWVAFARVVDGTEAQEYTFRVVGSFGSTVSAHVYGGVMLALSPYKAFGVSSFAPETIGEGGSQSYDDLWTQVEGNSHARFSNTPGSSGSMRYMVGPEEALSLDDLYVPILLYQGLPSYGTDSSNDTMEGFTYVSGALSSGDLSEVLNHRAVGDYNSVGPYIASTVWSDYTITITAWHKGFDTTPPDPDRFSPVVTVAVPPEIRAWWQQYAQDNVIWFSYQYELLHSAQSGASPNSWTLQIMADDGYWRELTSLWRNSQPYPTVLQEFVPGMVVGDTLSFRIANDNDQVGGGFGGTFSGTTGRARTLRHFYMWLYARPPVTGSFITRRQISTGHIQGSPGVPVVHDIAVPPNIPFRPTSGAAHQGYYSFGIASAITFKAPVAVGRGRSYAQIVG